MTKLSRPSVSFLSKNLRLLVVGSILFASNISNATETVRWQLPEQTAGNSEYLVYRLSYRGLFTSYLWKDLADVAFISSHQPSPFLTHTSCDLRMKVSTENFSLAEFLRSTRYEWRSTVDPRLRQTFLIEETDDSSEAEQNATWVDWKNRRIELFRQRERVSENEASHFVADDDIPLANRPWEKDNGISLPPFLKSRPRIDGKTIPLIHDKTLEFPDSQILLDPLSLIYAARWHDYKKSGDLIFPVIYEDEINNYRVRSLGIETIDIAGKKVAAHRMEIKRANRREAKEEGFLDMWLSNDEWRIPLQFEIKAKVGKIRVHILPDSLRNGRSTRHCTSLTPVRLTGATAATSNR